MKTQSPAERFRQLVERPEVPDLPTTQQGRFDMVSNSILTAVSYLAEVVRTADGPTALRAACELIALEKARMRHRVESVVGAWRPPVEDPDIPPLSPLPRYPRAAMPTPVLDDDEDEEQEDWGYADEEAEEEHEEAEAGATLPFPRPVPRDEVKKPIPPRIDPFAPRPPGAPRAVVDGPPTISYHGLKLLEWKHEDPDSYQRLVLSRGEEPESVREYEAYFQRYAAPPSVQ